MALSTKTLVARWCGQKITTLPPGFTARPISRRWGLPRRRSSSGIRPHRILVGDPQGLPATVRLEPVAGGPGASGARPAGCFMVVVAHRRDRRRGRGTVRVSLPPAAMHLFAADSGTGAAARAGRAGGSGGMRQDMIIGVDAGTSVIKAVAFDLDGNELAATGRTNVYVDLPGGGAEQDMARTWDDTAAVLRDLALHVPDLARRTAALAITGQGDGTWLIDREGEPVAPAWLWLTSRAAPSSASWTAAACATSSIGTPAAP